MGSLSNYDTALRAEAKKVTRCFHHYDTDQNALLGARHQTRNSVKALNRGEFFYVHPDIPGIAFSKRFIAAAEALRRQSV